MKKYRFMFIVVLCCFALLTGCGRQVVPEEDLSNSEQVGSEEDRSDNELRPDESSRDEQLSKVDLVGAWIEAKSDGSFPEGQGQTTNIIFFELDGTGELRLVVGMSGLETISFS